jgi:hypothetical protein
MYIRSLIGHGIGSIGILASILSSMPRGRGFAVKRQAAMHGSV